MGPAPKTKETRPKELFGDTKTCLICLGPQCLLLCCKPLRGKKKASCPYCKQRFGTFWHTNGRPYVFYKQGHGAEGKLRNRRRIRDRKKEKGAAGNANQNEDETEDDQPEDEAGDDQPKDERARHQGGAGRHGGGGGSGNGGGGHAVAV